MQRPEMDDLLLMRYSRQIMLPEIDVGGQEALRNSKVLVIGAGGLGCPVSLYLAGAGVGTLLLADFDEVDLSNLQRQIAHTTSRLGDNKAHSAAHAIRELNDDVRVDCITDKLEPENISEFVRVADVVVDCTDRFSVRANINKACYLEKTPLVSGAAIRWEGQLSVFDFRDPESPCYHCLYGVQSDESLTCSEAGVVPPLVGVLGSMQALETLKLLTGAGSSCVGKLLVFDGKTASWREFKLVRDRNCGVCGQN